MEYNKIVLNECQKEAREKISELKTLTSSEPCMDSHRFLQTSITKVRKKWNTEKLRSFPVTISSFLFPEEF